MNGSNNGGMFGGLRPPEEETRRVNTDALWEDVLRPLSQSLAYGLSIIWQIVTVLAALTSWAMAWAESNHADPLVGDMPNLIAALIGFMSFFVVGVIVSHERIQWLIGRVAGYDETTLSNGVTFLVVVIMWAAVNVLFNHTVVFVLMTVRIIPIMATVIAVGSWFACGPLREGLRGEMQANARNNSSQWWIALENNRHAKEMAELQHDWDTPVQIAPVTQEIARFVPVNHGSAKSIGIGNQTFTADELTTLHKFIDGWDSRGTARSAWTADNGQYRLSDPEWDKFTSALRVVGVLDKRNHPTMTPDAAVETLKIPPYPAPELAAGPTENTAESRPIPSHPVENGTAGGSEALDRAIKKKGSRRDGRKRTD